MLNDAVEKLRVRNRHLSIADSTEGDWETIRQYESNPTASDSDDESRIHKPESSAVKKNTNKTNPATD